MSRLNTYEILGDEETRDALISTTFEGEFYDDIDVTVSLSFSKLNSYISDAFRNNIGLTKLELPNLKTLTSSTASNGSGGTPYYANSPNLTGTSVTEVRLDNFNRNLNVFPTTIQKIYAPKATGFVDNACKNCVNLTDVTVGDVTYVGNSAFSGCTGLTNIDLTGINYIDSKAFQGCTNLGNVGDISNATFVNYAFENCENLTTTNTALNFSRITNGMHGLFKNCKKLVVNSLPNLTRDATSGNDVFLGCTSIIEINMPNYEYSMAGSMFKNCTSLRTVNAPKLTNVSVQMFNGCTALASINSQLIESIGDSAFENCTSLTSLDTSKVTSIGGNALKNTNIKVLDLPKVTYFGGFSYWNQIEELSLPILTTCGAANSFLRDCTSLKSIDMPMLTEFTGSGALYFMAGTAALKCAYFPNLVNITSSGNIGYAFQSSGLVKIAMPSLTLEKNSTNANNWFCACTSLKYADLGYDPICPNFDDAYGYGCNSLETLVFRKTDSIVTVSVTKLGKLSNVDIYVPSALLSAYQSDSNWSAVTNVTFHVLEGTIYEDPLTGYNSISVS